VQQAVQVAAVGCGEEPPRDLLALCPGRLEPWLSLVDMPPGRARICREFAVDVLVISAISLCS
jgi:hypothetical protein